MLRKPVPAGILSLADAVALDELQFFVPGGFLRNLWFRGVEEFAATFMGGCCRRPNE